MDDVFYDHFYSYVELGAFLETLRKIHPARVQLKELARTSEGRAVHIVEINDPSTGVSEDKPAYYVQAGLHAQEGAGTTAAFHFMHTLLTDPAHTGLLEKVAFYIAPRVNPDGTERALSTRQKVRSRFVPIAKKNGLVPQDLNSDGLVLSMRWEDPAGPMKIDDVDSRLMVRRQPGDRQGPFYQVFTEGVIQDYDGGVIEDGIRSIDFNRNWPRNWESSLNSSAYPFSEPEMKAIGDFLLKHPNVFAGIDFHCGTNAILRVATDANSNEQDLELIVTLGKLAESMTGFPLSPGTLEYREGWRPTPAMGGNSLEWAYHKLGISHYIIELGNGFNNAGISAQDYFNADATTRETVMMRRVLALHDRMNSDLFVPWEKVKHPQLGMVEVGGIMNGCGYYMCPRCMEDIVPRTTAFLLAHASRHPALIVSRLETRHLGGGIHRIRTAIGNVGGLATNVMNAGAADMKHPVRVRLTCPDGVEQLSRAGLFEVETLQALGGSASFEWFVKTGDATKVTIEARHPRAGIVRTTINL